MQTFLVIPNCWLACLYFKRHGETILSFPLEMLFLIFVTAVSYGRSVLAPVMLHARFSLVVRQLTLRYLNTFMSLAI